VPHAVPIPYQPLWQRLWPGEYQAACRAWSEDASRTWVDAYQRTCSRRPRDIVEIDIGFRYLFDLERDGEAGEERVVAAYGFSCTPAAARDSSYMRGFPIPARKLPFNADRGHFASHAQGGTEQGINLFPQMREFNRGWSPRGKVFREMERSCAAHPGTFFWARPIYADASWIPRELEYGVITRDGQLWVNVFANY
jgi:hypothetical protein